MTVKITARAELLGKSTETGLIGQVYRIDEEKGVVFLSSISIPLVNYGSDKTHNIDELSGAKLGNYVLQLELPNGKVITEGFEIQADEPTILVIDLPQEGPHGWTTWHAMAGQISPSVPQPEGCIKIWPSRPKMYNDLSRNPHKGYALDLLGLDQNTTWHLFGDGQTITNLAELIRKNIDVRTASIYLGNGTKVTAPSAEDNTFALFRFSHAGVLDVWENELPMYEFYPRNDLPRHYLVQESISGASLICLPTPWNVLEEEVGVELLVNKTNITGSPDVSMTIGDPLINTVLGYVNTGAIHKAVELINLGKAQQYLFSKVSCPLAAAVGGYLLVLGVNRKEYRSRSDTWQAWVQNLDHWFEWLPDGAILHAALYFLLGDANRDKAHDALMRSYDRGLPFFTFGLKLMMDGMRYFAREGDDLARERLGALETIANQTDPSQTFLSVKFSQHW